MQLIDGNHEFCRINTRITKEAYDLLDAAVEERMRIEPRHCTQGVILNEIILKALRPQVKRPTRGRPPKVQPKPVRSTKRVEGKAS